MGIPSQGLGDVIISASLHASVGLSVRSGTFNTSSFCFGPWASPLTDPAGVFITQPTSPNFCASSAVLARKFTPCTW